MGTIKYAFLDHICLMVHMYTINLCSYAKKKHEVIKHNSYLLEKITMSWQWYLISDPFDNLSECMCSFLGDSNKCKISIDK
jgi:hypothetical protein